MIVNYITKNSIVCKFFAAIFFLSFFSATLSAQLTVTPGVSAATLVSNLTGQGLTVSNVTLNCPTNAYGTFANGNTTNIGITNGILLTTGNAVNAIGPNNSASAGTCNGTSGSDPQLTAIEPQATEDLCVLEFDIVPQCNSIQIRFVFGSEEYPEFVSSSFNDAFGFFISGPGPACQAGFYNNTNVATLPNNVTPVSIDNVNATTNNAFYVNNNAGTTIQYDGFTTVLTRTISLCPCQSYHWKLAIADAGDCSYDSGVFIDFMSCSNALTLTSSSTGTGCSGCSGTATVTTVGGTGPFTYSWSPSGGNAATATGLCAGTYTCTVVDQLSCSPASTIAVTIASTGTPITLSPSQTNIACNGQCTGTASVTIVTGTGPFSYSWAPSGGTGASTTGRCAGTYTCTVTGAGGCTTTQTFNITQPPAITATPSQVNVTCNGTCTGSATVVAAGGNGTYTYAWAPSGGTAATASGLCAGTYTCTISSPVGCSITQSFNITQPPAITATQSQVNVTCFGACNGSATVVASGGTGTYTYAWAPSGGTSATASGLCAGTYTCTISSPAGCSITKIFSITQPPQITATPSQVNVTCNGACTGSATVVAAGGNGTYTYAWAPSGGTAATASGLCAGTYTCTISSPVGCSITQSFNITQPPAITATQSQVNVTCFGACNGSATVVASGGTGTYTYAWAPSGGTAATASGLCEGTYTCTISSPAGCSITKTFTITQPPQITATQSQVNVTCNGGCNGSATVVASGGTGTYSYAWAPSGGTAATATGLCAGTYTCTISSPVGCSITQSFNITQPPAITATQSQVNITCFGACNGSATVVASGGTGTYTYAWAPSGGTAATASGLCAGTYTCTISSPVGCSITQSFNITQPPAITATQSQVNVTCFGACNGSATVVASGGTGTYTYAWAPSGGTAATASGLCAGTYTCTISSPVGCSITKTFSITQPPQITATQSQVNVTCNGGCNGSATVVASGGTGTYTYAWAPSGGTAATATGLCAGTYTCTISSPVGCSITSVFTITQPTPLTASTTTTAATCGGTNGTATVTPAGGVGPYSYSWAPSGGTGATASGLAAGSYTVTVTSTGGCTVTAVAVVLSTGGITASITASTNVTCFGGNTGSATAAPTGGTGPYIYSWAPSGGSAATATGLAAGSYTCTITDANGCIATASITITQPPAITATQSQTNLTCNGICNGTASVVASGGTGTYTYAWAPSGGTAATATGLCAGTYTCTISSPVGCSITKTFTLTQPTAVTGATSSTSVVCNGGSTGTATVVASGGTPGYTYSWAPAGGTGATTTGVPAGNYTVTITDLNGCTGTATVVVTQPTAVTASTTTVTATCGNPNGSATVTPGGGVGPYTFAWAPSGGTSATATGLLAGSYTVTVTDSRGCTQTATATIINSGGPSASISATTNVTCFGGNNGSATVSVVGGTGPFGYSWAPSGGTGSTASSLIAGSYTVTVTDVNGCTATATATITQPPVITATQSQVNVTCNAACNGSATVVASGGTGTYTYAWAPSGGTAATATGLCAGTYTCTISSPVGCSITQTFTITQPTAVTGTTSSTSVVCNGGSTGTATVVASGGTPGYTYSWAPTGGTGSTTTGVPAGNYTVTITDLNGCTGTATVLVTQPTAVTASTTTVTATCGNPNGSATVTPGGGVGPYTFVWAPSGGTGATATGLLAGNYTVTVTDAQGCSTTATAIVPNSGGPAASISAFTNVSCFGGNNGSATVSVVGGTGPFGYSWAPSGGNGATASSLIAGTYTVTVTDVNGCITTASVTLTQPPVLTASATSTPVLCNGGATGTATVTPGGGSPIYSYNWAPSGGTNATATGLTATTYTCTVTDANGCTVTATTTVTQPTALTATISTTPVLCNGGNTGTATVVASGATPGYSYSWAPSGGTNANASGLVAGNYTCTITDANGCSITSSITVTEPPVITLATSFTQSTCGNANGSASVVASGGTPGYLYSWSPSGGSGSNATGLVAGTYVVTVTDANLCTQTATVVVPNAGSPTAAITATTNVSCFGGNNGSATVTGAGGTLPYTYAWSPTGGTGATGTPLIAGSYTVTLTDANGCSATATVTITQPPVLSASASSTPVLCNGGTTGTATVVGAGGVTPYSYSWAPSGGTGSTATGLSAGTYTCTVTDANGCTTTASTTVTEPTALTVSTTQSDVLCNGGNTGSATVTVGGGTLSYSYAWTPSGGTNATASGLIAGGFTCTITDGNGCIITASVLITEPPALTLATSFVQSTCGNANGSASVVAGGGTPGYFYSWAPSGGTGATETGLLAASYTVTVSDSKGCMDSATVVVPNAGSPTAAITASTNISCFGGNNGSITVTGAGGTLPYTYAWSPSGGTGATETGLIAGSYSVVITDANNCTATASITLTEPPVLTISGSSTNVDCFGNTNGTASVVAGGGVTAYTYAWSPSGGITANEVALAAGTYTCDVTDANGCTISQSLTVTEPPQLTLAVAGFNVNCFNACDGQVVVIPSGGVPNYTFSWNTGCTSPSCNNICAGTYTVDVTDANGCLTSASTSVTQPTAISITTAEVDAHCNQADGSASANATGGTGTLTYQWIGGPANANYNAIAAGTYSVIVTDANGCSDTATVVVNNLNGVNASLVSVTNLTCFQSNDGAIVTNAAGGNGPYIYTWTPNVSATNSASPIPANAYTVVVTDANGCTSTVTATVTQPTDVTLSAVTTAGSVCAGTGTQLTSAGAGGTPGYTYSWMPGPLAGSTQNVVPAATTTYTVYVADANGCVDSATVLVVVNPVPVAILFGDVTSGCAPLCVNFTDTSTVAAPGVIASWTWDFGDGSPVSTQQDPIHCFINPGSYPVSLNIVTTDGCTSSIIMPGYINVFANPVASFGASPQPATILNPEITFTDSSQNANSWNWNFGDLISSTSVLQNPTFTYSAPDCYLVTLEVTSVDGCVDDTTKEICIAPDAIIYVPNAFTPNDDGTNEEFIAVTIGMDPDNFEMWIFDRWGNMIFYTDDLNKGWDGRVQGHSEISQIDTYVWKIKAIDMLGNKHNLVGKVSLIK